MEKTIPLFFRSLPLFVMPVFGLFSFMWSAHPSAAIRDGVLLTLTPLTVLVIANRMDLRHALRCMMFAGWIAAILVLPNLGSNAAIVPYGSRNVLAMQMTFMSLLSLTAILNKREMNWVRMVSVPFVPLGIYLVIASGSATSLVFAVLGPVALILAKIFWVDAARVAHMRTSILTVFFVLVIGVLMIVLSMPTNNFEDQFLQLVGRERNLSGRTTIWMAGRVIQDQHPMFGTGLAGFWNPENGAAQSINFYDYKPFGTKLTFHNAFMEVRVHLGWIGFWMFVAIWVWCGFRILKTWLQSHHMEASMILVAALCAYGSTFTESVMFATFKTPTTLLYLGAISGMAASRKRFVGRIPVVVNTETRELKPLNS